MSTHLAGLLEAADQAADDLRAIGGIPGVLRRPDAEDEANARWEAAHEALTAARREAQMEAGR